MIRSIRTTWHNHAKAYPLRQVEHFLGLRANTYMRTQTPSHHRLSKKMFTLFQCLIFFITMPYFLFFLKKVVDQKKIESVLISAQKLEVVMPRYVKSSVQQFR